MTINFFKSFAAIAAAVLLFASCKEEKVFTPKPRVYPKVDFPARNYTKLQKDFCAFTFDYPDYMIFQQDTKLIHRDAPNACWFNLSIPSLNGDIHFTYTDLSKTDTIQKSLFKIYDDAYRLAQEHVSKSSGIEDFIINNPDKNLYGVLFNIEGHVASPFQLVMTDSTNHAIRASLYFKSRPDADSMGPVIEFVKTDVMGILNSFEWKKK